MMWIFSSLTTAIQRVEGIPLPYLTSYDNNLLVILLICFFVTIIAFSRNSKYLMQLVHNFTRLRQRSLMLSEQTVGDERSLLLLTLQSCLIVATMMLCLNRESCPEMTQQYHTLVWIGLYFVILVCYLLAKVLIYRFIGWIFFDSKKIEMWMESYFTLIYFFSLLLFPILLFSLVLNLSASKFFVFTLIFLSISKILMIYRWIKLFCENSYGVFLIIVYFCALEVLPCILLYDSMIQVTDYLITKF